MMWIDDVDWGKTEDLTQPAGATLHNHARCSGLKPAGATWCSQGPCCQSQALLRIISDLRAVVCHCGVQIHKALYRLNNIIANLQGCWIWSIATLHELGLCPAHLQVKLLCLFTVYTHSISQLAVGCAEQTGIVSILRSDGSFRRTLRGAICKPWSSDGQWSSWRGKEGPLSPGESRWRWEPDSLCHYHWHKPVHCCKTNWAIVSLSFDGCIVWLKGTSLTTRCEIL